MPRNIEIKARAIDFARQSLLARELGAREPAHLFQEDTFFDVPHGRLKLRDFGNGQGELIEYARENTCEPRESRYSLVPTSNPNVLKHVLGNAIGVRAVVRKHRWVHKVGRSRIHLDRVESLGDFIEIEVVLDADESSDEGVRTVTELMTKLKIERSDLVESAYVDMIPDA